MECPQLNLNNPTRAFKRVVHGFDGAAVVQPSVGMKNTLCVYE